VWTREHTFEWDGRLVRQVERYYLVRVDSDAIAPQIDLAAEAVHDVRWWTLDEIEASDEEFAPRRIAALVRDLLAHGPPDEPLDAGV
jgi:hypothetical protein